MLTRLLAPFVPFITEEVWQQVIRPGTPSVPESVHLARWPQPDTRLIDSELSAQVAIARALAVVGRAARKAHNIRLRQPLARALVGLPAGTGLGPALLDDISDELNVKRLDWLDPGSQVIDVHVKPNFRQLGKRLLASRPNRSPRRFSSQIRARWSAACGPRARSRSWPLTTGSPSGQTMSW
jgi:isoleucyl-tRNA synthetase